MKLLKLSIANFKGIRKLVLDTQGGSNMSIYGDNATGKSTLFDAFSYLLFDKDSQNKKDFTIKTLDAHGNEIHNLDHEVEGCFEINGQKLTLRKVYAEKWTKKRGSAQATFTGHTTDYYIDGVPASKGEYTNRISQIVNTNLNLLKSHYKMRNNVKDLTTPKYLSLTDKLMDAVRVADKLINKTSREVMA